jgi:mono/diheme cytochrome c family protein
MKMTLLSGLMAGALSFTATTGFTQPWSVAATNAAPRPVPPNWSNVITAATPVPAPVPPATPPVHPAPMPAAAPQLSAGPMPAGILAFDSENKEYIAQAGELNCPFVFHATNISPATVVITHVQTSCGCTTAKLQLPMTLAPGASAEIPLNMNVAGKTGQVIKGVTIHTDKGFKGLTVKTDIRPPAQDAATMAMNRERNQQLASADRQAVFKGDCAKCHVEPLIGKTGKELFTAACGICHEAEHRATMVTDLHNLKITPNAEYWKFFIVNGKPATLMPAFSQAQGGPLSDAQVNSLVDYLVNEFPHSKTNAVKHASAH